MEVQTNLNKSGIAKTKMVFRGSMPPPQREHGEELLGGVIIGREWDVNWEYKILLPNGHILYHKGL